MSIFIWRNSANEILSFGEKPPTDVLESGETISEEQTTMQEFAERCLLSSNGKSFPLNTEAIVGGTYE
jgi:hypothetical protein